MIPLLGSVVKLLPYTGVVCLTKNFWDNARGVKGLGEFPTAPPVKQP